MSFSASYANLPQSVGKCKVCGEDVPRGEDMTVDRITIHTKCFICPICQAKCFVGSCARDQGVESRYGVYWYCGEHMLLPPGQKISKLQELNMGKGHKKANGPAQDVKKAEKTKELQAKLKEAEEQRKKYEQLCKDLEAQLKAL